MKARLAAVLVLALLGASVAGWRADPPVEASVATPLVLAAASDPVATVTVVDGTTSLTFPVRSLTVGMAQDAGSYTGGGGGTGVATLDPITVVKVFDAHTVRLHKMLLTGKHLQSITIVLHAGGSYTLSDAQIISVKSAVSGGGTPTDRVSFDYRQLAITKGNATYCWDLSLRAGC